MTSLNKPGDGVHEIQLKYTSVNANGQTDGKIGTDKIRSYLLYDVSAKSFFLIKTLTPKMMLNDTVIIIFDTVIRFDKSLGINTSCSRCKNKIPLITIEIY